MRNAECGMRNAELTGVGRDTVADWDYKTQRSTQKNAPQAYDP